MCEKSDDDHSEIAYVKAKMAKLVQNELGFLDFQDQLTREEEERLLESAVQEVKERSSFFFRYDDNRVETNLHIFDDKAPGNRFHQPSIAIPHEGVHIQRYIDTSTLTPEKMTEIYAYYQFLIDLHIAQVRPDNRE